MESAKYKVIELFTKQFDCRAREIDVRRMRGYNNISYQVIIHNKSYFAKVANPQSKIVGSSILNEADCLKLVYPLGLGPKVIFFDEIHSILITEFLNDAFDESMVEDQYMNLLRSLHSSKVTFSESFCPIQAIKQYEKCANQRSIFLPADLIKKMLPKIYEFDKKTLFLQLSPCHLDPQFDNVREQQKSLYLVDWEFSAMSDPFFDLASMCASEEITEPKMQRILAAYLQRLPTLKEQNRFFKLKIIADIRMCLFCYLYTTISHSKDSMYKEFAEGFLARSMATSSALDELLL